MIINNTKSVTGIFKYDPEAEYEKGDFVVYSGCMYICKAVTSDTISGVAPDTDPENFVIYLGDQVASLDEYYNYIKKSQGEIEKDLEDKVVDKYISMPLLSLILNKMYFGLNDSGVITNYVNTSEDFSVKDLDTLDESTPLISIIKAPELNNGVLRVKRDLNEISLLVPQFSDTDDEYKSYYSQSHKDYLILKQYTYDSDPGEGEKISRYRVQELIDPIYGNTYYRYTIGNITSSNNYDFSDSVVTEFMNSFSGDVIVGNKLRNIESYINNLNTTYNTKLDKLGDTFRFRSHPIELGSTSVEIKANELSSNFNKDKSNLFTVLIRDNSNRNITGMYSITVDSFYSKDKIVTYKIEGLPNTSLKVSITTDGSVKFELITDNGDIRISNIYFQSNFIKDSYLE